MKISSLEKVSYAIEQAKENLFLHKLLKDKPDYDLFIKTLDDILAIACESEETVVNYQPKNENEETVINYQSKGEKCVANALKELGFTPYHNVIKKDCCGDFKPLPFDFGVLVNGRELLIEYDGEQHRNPVSFFGGIEKFEETSRYDSIKDDYCNKNNIPLLRITQKSNSRNIKKEIERFISKYE